MIKFSSGFNKGIFTIPNFFLIGTTIVSQKIILLLIAYFFTSLQYNTFNRAYYTASILIIFGTLGFEYAFTRIDIKLKTVAVGVLINVCVTFTILYLLSEPFTELYQVVSVFVYALFASLGGIFTFQYLFRGNTKMYVVMMLTNAALHISIIPVVKISDADIFLVLPFVTLIWFMAGLKGFISFNHKTGSLKTGYEKPDTDKKLATLYKLGLTTFIINSAVSLSLVADKYIVNHFFPIETANAYTFSWGLIAPIFYIGNLVEKMIYSSTSKDSMKVFRKAFIILFLLVAAYSVSLLSAVNFLPQIIPASVNTELFIGIISFMITGYAVYCVINFPVNGFLFKFAEVSKQKKIAASYVLILTIVPLSFFLIKGSFVVTDYKTLLLLIWTYIFSLAIVKTLVVFFPKAVVITK
ncbi:MAG: hypothetical protein IPM56_15975 [Ignavibacteriales bacterium]|nr:MAG: hypothetical protein IPM56_15975 [Ignavibacteriales bacterium]